jgi:hypothetical protein
MPLRPVSELGLVDVTDLASREGGRKQSVRSPSKRAGSNTPKNSSSTPQRRGTRTARNSSSTAASRSKRASTSSKAARSSRANASAGGSRPRSQRERTGDSHEPQSRSRNGDSRDDAKSSRGASIGISVLTGAVGVAGGVLLGRTALQRQRKVFGSPLRSKVDIDLGGMGEPIGEASRQFGKLAGELRNVRQRTERIGHALSD